MLSKELTIQIMEKNSSGSRGYMNYAKQLIYSVNKTKYPRKKDADLSQKNLFHSPI